MTNEISNLINALEVGGIRSASKVGNDWVANAEVKEKILQLFRSTKVVEMDGGFVDKSPLAPKHFKIEDNVRLVPGGSSVRPGSYIGKNVVIMPPSFINIGAYIDDDTMIDSHVLVGSCAQIGKRIHIAAGVKIGGVLEPAGARPVIIEDDCFIGAGAILVEGIILRSGCVIAPGVVLSKSVPIYDTINETIYKEEVPTGAVVVPGSRPINNSWGQKENLHANCAIIIKYKDAKTTASVALESALR